MSYGFLQVKKPLALGLDTYPPFSQSPTSQYFRTASRLKFVRSHIGSCVGLMEPDKFKMALVPGRQRRGKQLGAWSINPWILHYTRLYVTQMYLKCLASYYKPCEIEPPYIIMQSNTLYGKLNMDLFFAFY